MKDAAVQGHNVRYCGLITFGECWHNNHHAFPSSAKLGLYPGQFDPGWYVLKFLEYLGVVKDIKEPKDFSFRKELVPTKKYSEPITKIFMITVKKSI